MNVLLRDADDKSLRVMNCTEVYVWSERNILLFKTNASEQLIPLEKHTDGLYAKTADGSTTRHVNDILAELYRNGNIDLSAYDSYYSGDDAYLDLLCGDMTDPTLDDSDDISSPDDDKSDEKN